jgi:N-dimethylarginine dimethylaminohydrolase
MDVLLVIDFPSSALNIVMEEIFESNMNRTFLKRFSINTIEVHSSEVMTCNLNWESNKSNEIAFYVVKKAIDIVLPPN